MLKIAALIAFLFCQLVVEACPAITRAKGESATEHEPGASVEAAAEPSRANVPVERSVAREALDAHEPGATRKVPAPIEPPPEREAQASPENPASGRWPDSSEPKAARVSEVADGVARRLVTVVCGSMTSIQRFERRIRHDQVRFRSGKEVS